MRRDVQEIFRTTPHEKQVMMFSATLAKEIRPICKKFMQDVIMSLLSSLSLIETLVSDWLSIAGGVVAIVGVAVVRVVLLSCALNGVSFLSGGVK
jgi:hypothetical protein